MENKSKKEIKVTCEVKERMALSDLKPLQGELKILSKENLEKLKKSIKKHGFSFPLFVWNNPSDAQIYCLDGHQRINALKDLKKEGYSIPQLPVVFIEAKDEAQAKTKLLAVASQYGKFDKKGLMDFLDFGMSPEEMVSTFEIPDFDVIDFVAENILQPDEDIEPQTTTVSEHQRSKETKVEINTNQVKQVQLFLSLEEHERFLQQAAFMIQNDGFKNLTEAVVEAMNEKFNSYKK